MSGIEILGIAASVLQLADVGARLSVKLFTFSRKVKNAKRAISQLSQEIASTGAALHELADVLEDNGVIGLGSQNAIATTKQLVADCWRVFKSIAETMRVTVIKGDDQEITMEVPASFSFRRRLRFPFVEPDVALLMAKLESLKSSLMLMLQIMSVALRVKRQPAYIVPDDQQALIQTLLLERKVYDAQFSRMTRRLDTGNHDGDDNDDVESILRPPDITLVTSLRADSDILSHDPSDISVTPKSSDESDSEDELPPRISIRTREIKHHALLTHNLVKEVGKTRYEVGHGIRHNMEHAILDAHYQEWLKLARKYDHDTFLHLFPEQTPVYQYWMDKYDSGEESLDEGSSDDGVKAPESISHGAPGVPPDTVPLSDPTKDPQQDERPRPMQFKDAVGRKYRIPWNVACEWTQMRPLITKMFAHIDGLSEHAAEMRYDIAESDGNLIMPDLWDATVEPGMSVNMMFWPLPEPITSDQHHQEPAQTAGRATEPLLPPMLPLSDIINLDSLSTGPKKKKFKSKGKKSNGAALPNWVLGNVSKGMSRSKDGKEGLPEDSEKQAQGELSNLLREWTTLQSEEVDEAVGKSGAAAGGDGEMNDNAETRKAGQSGQPKKQEEDEEG